MKLQREITSLRIAIDGQLELLGTLALAHRPPTVDARAEVAELSQIQEEQAKKETTIDSLRQTKGGGSAVKELKLEASQLRDRQSVLMIAIGRKALAARAEMPSAAGAYTALDRLQSSLEANESELKVVVDAIGPLWHVKGGRLYTLSKPAMVVGTIGGGLIVLYLLWGLLTSTFFATDLPSWVRCYVPGATQAIVYFNADSFRKTPVFEKLEGLLPSRSEIKRCNGLQLCPYDIREAYFLVQEDGSAVLVVRTREDFSLANLAPKGARDFRPEKCKGFEYIHSGNECCAKTGACTYCIAPSEDSMERTLKRLDRKEAAHLDKNLQLALESVANNDYYVAAASSVLIGERGPLRDAPRRLRRALEKMDYATAYLSFGSTIRLQYLLAFDKPSDAEDCREAIDFDRGDREKLEAVLESFPAPIRKAVAKLARQCGDTTTIVRKGNLIHSRTDLEMADVQDLLDEAKKLKKPASAACVPPNRLEVPLYLGEANRDHQFCFLVHSR